MTNDDTPSQVAPGIPVARGDLVAGKYLIGPPLGQGGMGIVIEAEDKVLGRKVAIKFMLPSLAYSARALQRFIREARVASRITSEHAVRLLEIGTLPTGTPFFVMEHLQGKDFRMLLAEAGTIPLRTVADSVLQALEAVAEGHRLGIIHRDIKPSNLFLTTSADGSPLVKVLDFGIAKAPHGMDAIHGDITGSGETRLGSLPYISPEQFNNPGDVDVRTDIWALGITLYELTCGCHPCVSTTAPDLALWLMSGEVQPPSRRRPELRLPLAFDEVVLRCLNRDRERRYSSVGELAGALAAFASPEALTSLRVIKSLIGAERLGELDSTRPVSEPSKRFPQVVAQPAKRTKRLALAIVLPAITLLGAWAWRNEPMATANAPRSVEPSPKPSARQSAIPMPSSPSTATASATARIAAASAAPNPSRVGSASQLPQGTEPVQPRFPANHVAIPRTPSVEGGDQPGRALQPDDTRRPGFPHAPSAPSVTTTGATNSVPSASPRRTNHRIEAQIQTRY